MQYQPELGQLLLGQAAQQYEAPDYLIRALQDIGEAIAEKTGDHPANPMGNTGARCTTAVFRAEAYSWDDDYEQPFNFKWGDLEVSWYKYAGRGTSCNRVPSRAEVARMLVECLGSL